MNFIFEWFFCPQHGLFRAENLMLAAIYGHGIRAAVEMWLLKFKGWWTL